MNEPALHEIVLDLIRRIEEMESTTNKIAVQQRQLNLEATRLIAELTAKLDMVTA